MPWGICFPRGSGAGRAGLGEQPDLDGPSGGQSPSVSKQPVSRAAWADRGGGILIFTVTLGLRRSLHLEMGSDFAQSLEGHVLVPLRPRESVAHSAPPPRGP